MNMSIEGNNYLVISKTFDLLSTNHLYTVKDKTDILYKIERTVLKKNAQTVFYEYKFLGDDNRPKDYNRIHIFGRSVVISNLKEYTGKYKGKKGTKIMSFGVIDKLEVIKDIKFDSTDYWGGFFGLFNYLKDLNDLGSHKAVSKIKKLENKLKKRDEQIDLYVQTIKEKNEKIAELKIENTLLK